MLSHQTKRFDVRILIFLYVAILMLLGTLGFANQMALVVPIASGTSVEDTARPN